jgi:hypothetical protein
MERRFATPSPVSLYVEIGAGNVAVDALATSEAVVRVEGQRADEVIVEQRGDRIVVEAPESFRGIFGGKHGFGIGIVGRFGFDADLQVTVSLPTGSDLGAKVGSADVTGRGRYRSARIGTGSGRIRIDEITEDSTLDTGSGDIFVWSAAAALRVKAGSGDVAVGSVAGSLVVAVGSGNVRVDSVADVASLKTGSGDIDVRRAATDVSATAASGDVTIRRIDRGSVRANAVSGDISVGVPDGVPTWTDIRSLTGDIRSTLRSVGQPAAGQDHVEIRATTISGDVTLTRLERAASDPATPTASDARPADRPPATPASSAPTEVIASVG